MFQMLQWLSAAKHLKQNGYMHGSDAVQYCVQCAASTVQTVFKQAQVGQHAPKQSMMICTHVDACTTGRHYLARSSPVAASSSASWPQFQPPARPFLPPASTAFGFNAALPSNAAAFGDNAALDQRLQSAGWPRPFQGLDARPFSPNSFSPAQAMRTNSGSLRQSIEQVCAGPALFGTGDTLYGISCLQQLHLVHNRCVFIRIARITAARLSSFISHMNQKIN